MTTLSLTTEFAASPNAVWAFAGDFGGLATWHPWVPNCTLSDDGLTRTIAMGAISAIEVLDPSASGERSMTYTVTQSPMPVKDYRCTWSVSGEGERAVLSIEASFEPDGAPEDQAVAMLTGFFQTAFDTLSAKLAS